MNQKEKQYALDRVSAIAKTKVCAIEHKYTTPEVRMTPEERLAALKKGAFKIRPGLREVRAYNSLGDVFVFDAEKRQSQDEKRIATETQKIRDEETRIKDLLMLGDAAEALELINEFAK